MEYDLPTATLIWEKWAPYIAPPEGHPLAGGDLAKDLIVAALCKPSPTAKQAGAAARTLIDAIANAITTQVFIDHTAQDLEEEDEGNMTVTRTPPHPLPIIHGSTLPNPQLHSPTSPYIRTRYFRTARAPRPHSTRTQRGGRTNDCGR